MNRIKHAASVLAVLVITVSWLNINPTASAGSKKAPIAVPGDVLRIVTPDNRARLCPKIDCGQDQELLRIPTNTKLKVESSSKHRMRMWDVIWYKVTYKHKQGWVSEFNTDKAPEEPRYR